jgi:putative oxidoreductase
MGDPSKGGVAWSLFLLRVLLGTTFILHGSQKLFGLFGGPGLVGFSGYVAKQMGLPPFLGYLASVCEFVGGWLVLLGLGTEVGALMIACVMLMAIFLVHWPAGYFLPKGFEYALNLLLVSLALIIGGAGRGALWDPFGRWRGGRP